MINLVYMPLGGGFTQTWDLGDGLHAVCDKEGILYRSFHTRGDWNKVELRKLPVLVPANHLQPYFVIPEEYRDHKWIRIESESTKTLEGKDTTYRKWMEECSKIYSEIYTFSFEDKDDYYGRKVRFAFPFLDDEIFKPIECATKETILTFGGITTPRRDFYAKINDFVEYGQSKQMNAIRENAISLNNLINTYKYVLCPTSCSSRMITGKMFYGMAARKLVFIQNNEYIAYVKSVAIDGYHAVYFDDETDLREKFNYYKSRPKEVNRIARNGYNLFLNNFTTRQFVRRVNEECGWENEEHQENP